MLDPLEIIIWKILRVIIYGYLKKNDDWLKLNNISPLKYYCKWLGNLLKLKYPASKFSFYFHIIIKHSYDLLKEFELFTKYANKGAENLHAGHYLSLERSTFSGGKYINKTSMEQVFYQGLRKFHLSSTHNIPWEGKLNLHNEKSNSSINLQNNYITKNKVNEFLIK
ncbi:hypothetical protein ABK040_010816 [Willaertia magna]